MSKFWDFIIDSAFVFFVPLVCSYYTCISNVFLNVANSEATGFERVGDFILAPCHYLFVGQTAERGEDLEWDLSNRFEYKSKFYPKTVVCALTAIPSFTLGITIKSLSLLSKESRERYAQVANTFHPSHIRSNHALYGVLGIDFSEPRQWMTPEGHRRRPGDENNLKSEKEGLSSIISLLKQAQIPYWLDCGTALGAYRYGGVIPWDEDIDIGVLVPDFTNVRHALSQLDPKKYLVQDWSSREHPKSYLKVYIRETKRLIDVYHFDIDPTEKKIHYILSLENGLFFPDWWKIRERMFTVPVSYDLVFPLKKALFDGIEVQVPNDTKKFLQRYYGENLSPAKIFDPQTGKYEKDLSHPYWQRAYVH